MTDYSIQRGNVSHGIRKEVIDSIIKQTALQSYKIKQACSIVPTSSWNNTFYREDPSVLTGPQGNAVKGLPRNATFPQAVVKWQEVNTRVIKYGLENNIPWEDIIAGDIDVQARSIIKLTEAVVNSVDTSIWDGLTEDRGNSLNIQSYAIATSKYWNGSSAALVNDIFAASRLISQKNYDTSNLYVFVSPRDKQSIMNYLADKGSQWNSLAQDIAINGSVAKIGGATIIESNAVTASCALVCVPKTCATWKELVSLRNTQIEDPYKSITVRVVEEGVLQLTDPKAICLIRGTQGADGL